MRDEDKAGSSVLLRVARGPQPPQRRHPGERIGRGCALTSKLVTRVIKGSINGDFAVGSTLEVTLNGSGNLSVMGATTVTGGYKLGGNIRTHKATATGGALTFSGGSGTVSVSFSGSGKSTNDVLAFKMKGKVTGGPARSRV